MIRTIELRDLFDMVFSENTANMVRQLISFKDEADKYLLSFILAGYDKTDIDINVENNTLIIKCDKNEGLVKPFIKKYSLPNDADVENITAKLDKGVLNIEISKIKTTKKISVN